MEKNGQMARQKRIVAAVCGLLAALLLISACTHSGEDRAQSTRGLLTARGWIETNITTPSFNLHAFHPARIKSADTVYIYIEGDGRAWVSRSKASSDPTPSNPLAFELAYNSGLPAVYLARPCQYTTGNDQSCGDKKWWTSHRFAPEVITATNQAVDKIKQMYNADQLVLIGYSGGGAIAALVAAKRDDIAELITIAGNLDTEAWTNMHKVSPLTGSLNPSDQWPALQNIPQRHFVGGNDEIIPPAIAHSYAAHFPPDKRPEIISMDGYDHACCWTQNRPEFYLR